MDNHFIDLSVKLEAVIDTAIDGVIVIDAKGVIEEINQSALQLFGYEKDELIGKKVNVLMPRPDAAHHDAYMAKYQKTREAKIIGIGREVYGLTKSGDTFPFRLAVSEVMLANRIIYTGIVHDLTELKAQELARETLMKELEDRVADRTQQLEHAVNKLLQANRDLQHEIDERVAAQRLLKLKESELIEALKQEQELGDLKDRFISMASHEFRTPLSTILSSVSIIGKYESTDQQKKRIRHVDKIKASVNNLTGILNDFLVIGKLEEGKEKINRTTFQLADLVEEVLSDLHHIDTQNRTIVMKDFGDESIHSDRRILKNVLFNLITNGIKYTGPDGNITCRLEQKEDAYFIYVTDDGIGIPKADQKYLFQRFFRASNVENIQGTGLGLSIVRLYLDMVDGGISFESEEYKGTTFLITLPKA